MRNRFSALLLMPVFLLIAIDSLAKVENSEPCLKAEYTHQIEITSLMFPEIKEEEKLKVINIIKKEENVIDAVITQKGSKIELVLIVKNKTSKQRAKEISESFIRLVKTFSKDINPKKKLGKGIYNYFVRANNLNKEIIIAGIKENSAEFITWQQV